MRDHDLARRPSVRCGPLVCPKSIPRRPACVVEPYPEHASDGVEPDARPSGRDYRDIRTVFSGKSVFGDPIIFDFTGDARPRDIQGTELYEGIVGVVDFDFYELYHPRRDPYRIVEEGAGPTWYAVGGCKSMHRTVNRRGRVSKAGEG